MTKDELIEFLQEQFKQVKQEKAELTIVVNKLFRRMLVVEIILTKTKGFTKKRLETAQKDAQEIWDMVETGVKKEMVDKDIAQYRKYLPEIH